MMYTIRITYQTGDSFGSSTEVDEIPMLWCKLDMAQMALETIKEHKEACEAIRNARYKSIEDELRLKLRSEFWYNDEYGSHESTFLVYDDTCRPQKINAFWMGYFETILEAEIIQYHEEGERAMKITF